MKTGMRSSLQIIHGYIGLFENFTERAFWYVFCVVCNDGSFFSCRMIKHIKKALLFEKSNDFLWGDTW